MNMKINDLNYKFYKIALGDSKGKAYFKYSGNGDTTARINKYSK